MNPAKHKRSTVVDHLLRTAGCWRWGPWKLLHTCAWQRCGGGGRLQVASGAPCAVAHEPTATPPHRQTPARTSHRALPDPTCLHVSGTIVPTSWCSPTRAIQGKEHRELTAHPLCATAIHAARWPPPDAPTCVQPHTKHAHTCSQPPRQPKDLFQTPYALPPHLLASTLMRATLVK